MSHSDLQAAREALARLADAPRPVSRTTFNSWDATRQSLFCRAGGRITDDPKPPRRMVPVQPTHAPATVADLKLSAAADLKLSAEYRSRLA
jgi:hypothetical protein